MNLLATCSDGLIFFSDYSNTIKGEIHCTTEVHLHSIRVSWWSLLLQMEGGARALGRDNRLIRRIFNLTCTQRYFSWSHVQPPRINLYVLANQPRNQRASRFRTRLLLS